MSYLPPEDNFEESLEKVFGDRAREFSSELRETLRDLWSCGRDQGLEDAETDRQREEAEATARYFGAAGAFSAGVPAEVLKGAEPAFSLSGPITVAGGRPTGARPSPPPAGANGPSGGALAEILDRKIAESLKGAPYVSVASIFDDPPEKDD